MVISVGRSRIISTSNSINIMAIKTTTNDNNDYKSIWSGLMATVWIKHQFYLYMKVWTILTKHFKLKIPDRLENFLIKYNL